MLRSVAQPGSASGLGPEGRGFESLHSDHQNKLETPYMAFNKKKSSSISLKDCELSTLAALAQKGDKKAYNQLLTQSIPYIRNVLSGSLSDINAIEDVTQEVLISVHKALQTYSTKKKFKPWLYSIIQFRRIDYLRKYYSKKENVTSSIEENDFSASHVTNEAHKGEYKDIEAALNTLPDKQRDIFILMRIEGYTAKEVAEKMDMTESAVKVSVHRSLKKLETQIL